MKSNDFSGITEGKFMESVSNLDERLAEEEHFRIIDSTEELNELRHRSEENDLRVF